MNVLNRVKQNDDDREKPIEPKKGSGFFAAVKNAIKEANENDAGKAAGNAGKGKAETKPTGGA